MSPAIKVQNLGKEYTIGSKEKGNETFREMLVSSLSAPFRRLAQLKGESEQEERFWALKDVSFEVQPGEVVGIIGRNGAGKSTLLKILSRITEPTQGEINIRGRVASLLEVGTGFHPELTGRENIYLNGAILGMSRAEIKSKFDEIVDFSEVEKFLDTPVKRYSSGMYVRLAFAVAAHLESEIMIIDEVLAVGDSSFQQKCLGKMNDVSKTGRTVLFVSHQVGVIAQLCTKSINLDKGTLIFNGDVKHSISLYLGGTDCNKSAEYISAVNRNSEATVRIEGVSVCDVASGSKYEFGHDETISIVIVLKPKLFLKDAYIGIAVQDKLGRKVFSHQARFGDFVSNFHQAIRATVVIPSHFLTSGLYFVTVAVHEPNVRLIDFIEDCVRFLIVDVGSDYAIYEGKDYGCVYANCLWNINPV